MDNTKLQIKKRVSNATEKKIDALAKLWEEMFEPDIGCDHLEKLIEHSDAFFNDIISETQDRKNRYKQRIDCLIHEKNELKEALKEDGEEVPTNVPLHTREINIKESLQNLREKLKTRQEEIQVLLDEQKALCSRLNERERPLVADPLPSEAEMQTFRNYLDELKQKEHVRFDKILEIRSEIKQLMEQLEITELNEYDEKLVNRTDITPTLQNIAKLENIHKVMVRDGQFEKMKNQIQDMQMRLAQLSKNVDISVLDLSFISDENLVSKENLLKGIEKTLPTETRDITEKEQNDASGNSIAVSEIQHEFQISETEPMSSDVLTFYSLIDSSQVPNRLASELASSAEVVPDTYETFELVTVPVLPLPAAPKQKSGQNYKRKLPIGQIGAVEHTKMQAEDERRQRRLQKLENRKRKAEAELEKIRVKQQKLFGQPSMQADYTQQQENEVVQQSLTYQNSQACSSRIPLSALDNQVLHSDNVVQPPQKKARGRPRKVPRNSEGQGNRSSTLGDA